MSIMNADTDADETSNVTPALDQPAAQAKDGDRSRFYTGFGLAVLSLVFGGLAVWSITAPIDGAVIAPATLRVETNRKAVQHLEGGIVAELLVREGDYVRAGEPLVRLDDTVARANLAVIDSQLDELLARRARLIAERDMSEQVSFPEQLRDRMDKPEVRELVKGQRSLFEARRETLAVEIRLLGQRVRQLDDKIGGLEAQMASKANQLELLEQEIAGLRTLYKKGYAPITRILALEREAERLRGERGAHAGEIAETRNAIGEARVQAVRLRKDFREQVISELRDVQVRIAELTERHITAKDQLKRSDILAPREGNVLGLAVHTVGGVVTPGEPVMYIVPEDDALLIEARVRPQDIDKVAIGSEALIRLSAFNQRTTPEFYGEVRTVSRDSMVDEITGEPYYLTLIGLPEERPPALRDLTLIPGMPAETFIQTGERTAISYLLKPLTDSLARAFREE